MGKRTVTLSVKPRGEIRWNLDGTNVKEGKVYTGPIDIPGEGEATIYAYAEDAGVSATKTFTIRAGDRRQGDDRSRQGGDGRQEDQACDDRPTPSPRSAPARRPRRSSATAWAITVGKGDRNATTRFGPGTDLNSDDIEAFIGAARKAIGDEAAEVEFTFGEFKFPKRGRI